MRRRDAHLSPSEIDVLLRSGSSGQDDAGPIESAAAEALQHLATCDICRRTMNMHAEERNRLAQLRAVAQAERGRECPPDREWPRVAAGLTEATEAQALVRHAAACDHCGPLLRASAADFADQLTPDEEIFLSSLKSGREDWQQKLAFLMSSSRWRPNMLEWIRQHLRPSSSIPAWAYGSAIAALLVGAFLGIRFFQQTPIDNLLASAYTEQRTLELRIPKADHAPVRLTRGSMERSRLDRPPALLQAEALVARELRQHPSSPMLLQAMGRADLLDWSYEAAIQSFKHALEIAPGTPSLMTDLASAYFESAEANQRRARDYAAAIDLLDRALKSKPDDPVALFNRAIVYERMGLPDRAIGDWQHYLRVDRDAGWISEARKRLANVERNLPKTP